MSMLLGVSKKISESQEIRVSAEIQSILMRENLGTEHVKGDQLKVEYNFLFFFWVVMYLCFAGISENCGNISSSC
jgi:hypothetical protein